MVKPLKDDFPKVVWDQNAKTTNELRADWPFGGESLYHFVKRKVESGEWERVRKRVGSHSVPAYRRAKR